MKTNVRQTSLEAFWSLGSKLQEQEKKILAHMLPEHTYSRRELSQITGIEINAVCGRVNRLVKLGFLSEEPKAPCPMTGKNVIPLRRIK